MLTIVETPIKEMTSAQIVDALIELDALRIQTNRNLDMFKAELQARGVSIMEDRNQQYIRFHGNGGSASITDKHKLDVTNPDRLQKWLPEGVYKKNVSETTETKYKLNSDFESMLKAVALGDYTFEMTLDEALDQLHIAPDTKQRKLLHKKLKGDFEKDRKTLNAVFETEDSWEEELYFIHRIRQGELIRRYLPDELLEVQLEELKKCIVVDTSLSIGLDYDKEAGA